MPPSRLTLLAPPLLMGAGWLVFSTAGDTSGLGAYGTACAVVLGGLIAAHSTRRLPLVACAWVVLAENVWNELFEAHAMIAAAAGFLGGEVLLAVSAVAALVSPSRASVLAYLWTTLLLGLPVWVAMLSFQSVGAD